MNLEPEYNPLEKFNFSLTCVGCHQSKEKKKCCKKYKKKGKHCGGCPKK
jgi:hypothetical protein